MFFISIGKFDKTTEVGSMIRVSLSAFGALGSGCGSS